MSLIEKENRNEGRQRYLDFGWHPGDHRLGRVADEGGMMDDRSIPSGLTVARNHLRAAQDALLLEREESPSDELDNLLNSLMKLLLELKAVGSDARWAE